MNIPLPLRRFVRQQVDTFPSIPVEVVPESQQPPSLKGERPHYRTKGGTRINYPGAYSRRGWSNMEYCSSTLRVAVGEQWLRENMPPKLVVEWMKQVVSNR